MTEKEKEIKSEMLQLVDQIKDHTFRLEADERIPDLELKVILSKIEQLHQKAIVLDYLHGNVDDIIASSSAIQETGENENEEADNQFFEEKKEEEANIEELEPEEEINLNEESFDFEKIKQDISSLGVDNDSGISKNETHPSEATLVDKINQQPISNLKSAISLNDKFLFIQELFKGDAKLYDQTINELNHAADKSVASVVLNRLSFDRNSKTGTEFLTLVERRFL